MDGVAVGDEASGAEDSFIKKLITFYAENRTGATSMEA
jgi:hypothetical protein